MLSIASHLNMSRKKFESESKSWVSLESNHTHDMQDVLDPIVHGISGKSRRASSLGEKTDGLVKR